MNLEVNLEHPIDQVQYPSLLQSKEQILLVYPEVFDGIGCFAGPPYHKQVDPRINPKLAPCQPKPVHLKESFKQETDKTL